MIITSGSKGQNPDRILAEHPINGFSEHAITADIGVQLLSAPHDLGEKKKINVRLDPHEAAAVLQLAQYRAPLTLGNAINDTHYRLAERISQLTGIPVESGGNTSYKRSTGEQQVVLWFREE